MPRLLTALLVLGLATLAFQVPDRTAATDSSKSFKALKKEYEDAQKDFTEQQREAQKAAVKALQDAKTDEEKKEIQKKFMLRRNDNPAQKFSPRFLEFAEKNLRDPSAFEAVVLALRTSGGPSAKAGTWTRIMDHLRTNYAARPEIKETLRSLASVNDDATDRLLREVSARNPDRKIQARAFKNQADGRENAAQLAERLKGDDDQRQSYEERMGKEYVKKLLANADKIKKEAEEFTKLLHEKYGDIFPDLSIGKLAPEVVSQDIDGKKAKLSALKGKVVVLDIWATWCGPCRAMIPHERDMVERFKDKPFALISISADDEKKTLTDFLAKEDMPWTHWWAGTEGAILEDWDVKYFPTIYVLDAKGVIRHKNIRGEKLEEVVNELLKELEEKKAN